MLLVALSTAQNVPSTPAVKMLTSPSEDCHVFWNEQYTFESLTPTTHT
tara:strand:- start:4217 stop:4360 length:144 start_codon:yes stop_codon:yes gene_type:complete